MLPQPSIAHYRIVSKLGEGGMGAVYRATDTKLNRDVAIKVLPEAFAQDSARMQRFEREAQVLASLNHPNIAAIYGIEQGAIVMELVEGADLAGPLPVDVVMDYARQIATGLEAAHEKGIVHRDLKPANIKIAHDGTIKILDFGLAKASDASSAPVSNTQSPTLSLAMTQAGVILGTAAYMSPEQARGKQVDRRADIWAYGVILYELLTGRNLYGGGETVTDTLAAVVLKEPDYTVMPADTPPRLRCVIKRCLRKDPKQRLRDIGDARIALDEPEPEPQPLAARAAPARRAWVPWIIAAAGIAIATVTAGIALMHSTTGDSGPGKLRFALSLPPETTWPVNPQATQWVPSPDGRNLAMIAGERGGNALWIRPLGSASAHRLDKTEGANFPFWSPDSQSIGFFTEGSLRRVPASGGASVKICDLPVSSSSRNLANGGTWNQEGVIVLAMQRAPLQRVATTGGVPSAATALGQNETAHAWPQFLPDGRHFLYEVRGSSDVSGIYVQELGSTKRVRVMKSTMRAMWSPPGYLVFTREGNLFAQRMNPGSFQLEGEPLLVAEDVRTNEANGRSTFAISRNGVLVYRAGFAVDQKQISWRNREGKIVSAVGKPVHTPGISPSPDGKSVAFNASGSRADGSDVWVMDLATGVAAPVTHDSTVVTLSSQMWSPDSKRLVVSLQAGGLREITVASGQTSLLSKESLSVESWSPDGSAILCRSTAEYLLSLLALSEGHPLKPIITTPYAQNMLAISPDGKYVAYSSMETGAEEVYVATFPSFSVKRRISGTGGTYAIWAKDGEKLYYRAADGTLTETEIRTTPEIAAGEHTPLFKFGTGTRGNRFGVSADGQRFLVCEPQAQTTPEAIELAVIVDWLAEIKRQP